MYAKSNRFCEALLRLTGIRAEEATAVAWSTLYIISLFLAYYVLRPIRDELGVAGGVRNLPWLFTGTLIAMLALTPLFGFLVKRYARRTFISVAYRFFSANLIIFAVALSVANADQQVWVGRAFFIWVSVFNLFVVSVFWSFIQDIFSPGQGARLFGILSAGASLGGLIGSAITGGFIEHIGRTGLILLSVLLLEVAVLCTRKLSQQSSSSSIGAERPRNEDPVGGGVLSGMLNTLRSPYLAGIAVFILMYSVTSTFLYFQQASIAETGFADSEARTAFFAGIDMWVNAITLVLQLFLTGRLIAVLGVVVTICALPLLSVAGFASLAEYPIVPVLVAAQVARRVANFALARPTREVMFAVASREDRYKAKNFIDTVVYRSGDQIGSWSYAGLMALGLGIGQIAVVGIPISIAWLALSLWLGRAYRRKRDQSAEASTALASS